jgi:hypothetical protein
MVLSRKWHGTVRTRNVDCDLQVPITTQRSPSSAANCHPNDRQAPLKDGQVSSRRGPDSHPRGRCVGWS